MKGVESSMCNRKSSRIRDAAHRCMHCVHRRYRGRYASLAAPRRDASSAAAPSSAAAHSSAAASSSQFSVLWSHAQVRGNAEGKRLSSA